MNNSLVSFNTNNLPAHIGRSRFRPAQDMAVGGGYPIISIKGKVFHKVTGDERELITAPNGDDPAQSLEVVVVAYNPHVSKTYYAGKFVEGSTDSPACYSHDGEKPAADSESPQSKQCATCPHNAWGSRITEDGKKAKACADSRRLAIAPAGELEDVMLLRVPATSLRTLAQYQDLLFRRGVAIQEVTTRIGFDASLAYPALTFKPVSFLAEEQIDQVEAVYETEVVKSIITGDAVLDPIAPPAETPKPKAKKAAAKPKPEPEPEPKPEPEPEPEPEPKAAPADLPEPPKATAKRASVRVESEGVKVVEDSDALSAELDSLLDL